jgi:hypothetical protein
MHTMNARRSALVTLLGLAACGGTPTPHVTYTFTDTAVKPICACTGQTPLAPSDALGDSTVAAQQADLARTWQGTLHWREQPWFAASGETALSLTFTPREAFATSCPSDPTADCGAGRYAVFSAELSSADALLQEKLELRVAYLPEAHANTVLQPVGHWLRRKDAGEAELMLALSREGDVLKGKLYVLAAEAGPDSARVERVVGEWEAAPTP